MTARRRTGRARREQQRALADYRDRVARPTPSPTSTPRQPKEATAPAPAPAPAPAKKAKATPKAKPAPAAPKPAPKPAPPPVPLPAKPSGSSLRDRLSDREITLLLKSLVPPEAMRDDRRETF